MGKRQRSHQADCCVNELQGIKKQYFIKCVCGFPLPSIGSCLSFVVLSSLSRVLSVAHAQSLSFFFFFFFFASVIFFINSFLNCINATKNSRGKKIHTRPIVSLADFMMKEHSWNFIRMSAELSPFIYMLETLGCFFEEREFVLVFRFIFVWGCCFVLEIAQMGKSLYQLF